MGTGNLDSDFPTTVTEDYWVYASVLNHQTHPQKFKQNKGGKWLVFSDNKEHDNIWQKIKRATQDGILGTGAKAATSKPNPNSTSENKKVICIYTYNWTDKDDVYRVEQTLRSIGVETDMYYKTNRDTIAGLYKVNGSKYISKYISKVTKNYNKSELGALSGVNRNTIQILSRIGINNFNDLLAFDTSKKLLRVGISSERINKLKLSARSQIENKVYQMRPVEFPIGEIIHFDIETDLYGTDDDKKVWSIAVHHNKRVKRFFAETWKQEKKILKGFLKYLKDNKSAHLFSYSGFDKRVLKSAFIRHKLDVDFFLSCNHYDLRALINKNYVLPIGGYGLKEVGYFFGYKFKHKHFDGLYVATQYINCQQTGKKLPKNIFDYIEDDVKSMDYILNQLSTRKDFKQLNIELSMPKAARQRSYRWQEEEFELQD